MAFRNVAAPMAFRNVAATTRTGPNMTVDEFKEWLQRFDTDRDGRISRDELRRAMRAIRVRFTGWRSKRGISYADTDGDGYIDASEVDGLVEFVKKHLGLKFKDDDE